MTLRARVTAYLALAAAPAALVSVGAVVVLDRLIRQEIEVRTSEVVSQTEQMLSDELRRIDGALGKLAALEEIRQLEGALDDASTIERADGLAAARGAGVGLDLFAIVATEGAYANQIISSAHLPDAAGDPGPAFAQQFGESGVAHALVEGNPPKRVPALLSVRETGGLVLYGGTRLDGPRLASTARMGGATIELLTPPLEPLRFGAKAPGTGRQIPLTVLGLPEASSIRVFVHTPRLQAARERFLQLAVFLAAASLLLALVAGTVLSSRISKPIVELSEAAREVGRGNLNVEVEQASNDEVGTLVGVFNDMTKELAESRRRIARAERIAAWREIARRVAHEIKNPLFPIQVSMETLAKAYAKKHEKLDEIVAESTKTVLEEVQALNRIVTEFSEFARLPSPQKGRTSILDLLGHVANLYKDHGVTMVADEATKQAEVMVDRDQIGRALINLVKNALEAGATAVELSATIIDEHARLSVRDDGPGIPEEVRDKLFTPYFTTKESGTGLGLAIVDRIATEHDGRVEVSSSDRGTNVVLEIRRGI